MSDTTLFYSVRKAARILGILPGDVSQLCNDGILEAVHQGPVRTIPAPSLRRYAASLVSKS